MATVVIESLSNARKKATAASIKQEARQLFTLAQQHYMETGDYTTFFVPSSNYNAWLMNDSQTSLAAPPVLKCSESFTSSAVDMRQAINICNSIASKIPTNLSTGSAAGKLLIGCGTGFCTDIIQSQNNFSVMVHLEDTGSVTVGDWFCIGSSGVIYEGVYNATAKGCMNNP